MGHVICADCGQIVRIYSDGVDVRVAVHDVCGMGGKLLETNERTKRLAAALKRGVEQTNGGRS